MNSPAPSPFDRRPLVGIFALVLLALGAAVWWWSPENAAYLQFLRGAMIAGVIWLALPELQNPKNRWWMLGLLGAVLAVLLLPRYWSVILAKFVPALVVIIVVLKIFRPRSAPRPRR